jgi:hypothetical protein
LLYVVLGVPSFWIVVGLLGLSSKVSRGAYARLFFPLGALGGLVLAVAAFLALSASPDSLVLPLGLPDLPFHVRLDSLAAFFLLLLGAVSPACRCTPWVTSEERLWKHPPDRPAVSRVPCQHGGGIRGRRRLSVHGGLGDHGAGVVLSGNHRPQDSEIRRAGFCI